MKWTTKYIVTLLTVKVLITSCSRTTPAGFWRGFHKDLILTKNSDQGPWGGHREINWKGDAISTFTDKELIEFADKHNWKFVDSVSFSADGNTKGSFFELKIDDYSLEILKESILPKLNIGDKRIFIFETTWLAVEPGNNRETFENGFAVLNLDGTVLRVYHFWGE